VNVTTIRRVEAFGFALAMLGLLVAWFAGMGSVTHGVAVSNLVFAFVGPLTLPAIGIPASVVLLAATHRRRGRVFAALWATGSAASVLIVRMRAGNSVFDLDMFLCAAVAVAVGACLCVVGPRRGVVTPSPRAAGDGYRPAP
jgi:hypothetical protein